MALTELYALPIRIGGAGPVRVISGAIGVEDTIIYSPAADKCAFLVGQFFSEGNATNITFKSGSDTIVVVELAANQGVNDSIGNQVVIASEVGQDLIISPSVAISSAVFHVVEAASLVFN